MLCLLTAQNTHTHTSHVCNTHYWSAVLVHAAILQGIVLRLEHTKCQKHDDPKPNKTGSILFEQCRGMMGSAFPNNGISPSRTMRQLMAECFILHTMFHHYALAIINQMRIL